jgi:hypothetical protein
MIRGGTPALAIALTVAIGVRPCAVAYSRLATSTAAAPSLSGLEFPAVTVPSAANAGRSLASAFVLGERHGLPAAARRVGGDDLAREPAAALGGDGLGVAVQGEGVLVGARDPAFGRERLGRDAERAGVAERLHAGIDEAPAERRVVARHRSGRERPLRLGLDVGRAAHRLHAGADRELGVAGHDGTGGLGDGLQAGAAEPVHRHARHGLREAGEEHGHARHVSVVLARLVRAAHEDVVDVRGVDVMGRDELREHVGGEVVGADAGELPAVAAERGAQRAGDHGLPHAGSSV